MRCVLAIWHGQVPDSSHKWNTNLHILVNALPEVQNSFGIMLEQLHNPELTVSW